MIKQYDKRFRKSGSKGNHQVNWLWGKQSVVDTLEAGRWRVYELFVTAEVFEQLSDLLQAKQKEGSELEIVSATRLSELTGTADHQGIAARVSTYPYESMENFETKLKSISQAPSESSFPPMVVIIDRIQDSFEFGAILRCCEGARISGVIVGEHCQSQVTPQVARVSFGAVNHFPIVKTADLAIAAKVMQSLGLRLVTTDMGANQFVCDAPMNVPTALLIGSDAHPMDPLLLGLCDQRVRIPMLGNLKSLNMSVATGILLYEIRRQQKCLLPYDSKS